MTDEFGLILVVDDNEMNRDMLSRRLARRGFGVRVAEDGRRALESISQEAIDLVLLDVNMPDIDGFQVLTEIRRSRSVADLPVVMATARDRSEDVVHALQLGANDYVTKPLDFPVVLARVQTQLALKRAKKALETAHRRMKNDLEAAAKIQRSLMPATLPSVDGVRFAWRFEPCDELAGDILDIVPLDANTVGLYLLDVSGHGVPAALLSVTLSRVISHMADGSSLLKERDGAASRILSPVEVAERLNQRFPMDATNEQYFTFLYGVLSLDRHELRYVSAGHPGPAHLPVDGAGRILDAKSFAIGWFPSPDYEEISMCVRAGDRVYFYSDGVIEAQNPAAEQFGEARFLAALEQGRTAPLGESLTSLVESLKNWCGEAGPGDDVSLVALEIVA